MILAIESSCDETALALFDPGHGLRGEWVSSQAALHAAYGGVVPDLAAREHLAGLGALVPVALEAARGGPPLTSIAVTAGPGLAGCLALGIGAAKALGLARDLPVVGVHHLRGHLFSPFIAEHARDPAGWGRRFRELLPHLGMVVSGGHTLLAWIDAGPSSAGEVPVPRVTLLGQTLDDAAGEALDKGAKLLGLGYPGGPPLEKLAALGTTGKHVFPKPFEESDVVKFSFSGLKTSLRYRVEKLSDAELETMKPDLCADYQAAVVDLLVDRLRRETLRRRPASLGLSGGVANNRVLRAAFAAIGASGGVPALAAEPRHTGDNAAMIAFAGWVDPAGRVPPEGDGLGLHPSMPVAVVEADAP